MNNELSDPASTGLVRSLDRAEVCVAVTEQLRKDLGLVPEHLEVPPVGELAFEELRTSVLNVLDDLQRSGQHALQVALYRVDIPEQHYARTMAGGGIHALAGEVVLRALQKVLTRMRYAGRY